MNSRQIGNAGEKAAQKFLKRQGYRLVTTNYTCRGGEIDIIAWDKQTLVFVEVRSRSHVQFGQPQETVNRCKQQRLRQAATQYLHQTKQTDVYCRFDVVAVCWQEKGKPVLELYKDAF